MTMAPKEELTMTTHDTDAALPAGTEDLRFAAPGGQSWSATFHRQPLASGLSRPDHRPGEPG
jgi:hypothetical protein